MNSNDKLAEVWGVTAPIILAGGFDAEKAKKAVSEIYTTENVCIAFGRAFISTPGKAERRDLNALNIRG